MKSAQSPFLPWIVFGDVVLAGLFALVIFVLLNVASAGVLITLITFSVLFLIFGAIHYFIWGQNISHTAPVAAAQPEMQAKETILIELTNLERVELIQLLEYRLAIPARFDGKSNSGDREMRLVRRRNLLEKLRM